MVAGDDVNVTGKDAAGATYSTDTRAQSDASVRQVVVLGDATGAFTAAVDSAGRLTITGSVRKYPSASSALSSPAASTTSAVLLAANANRLGAVVFNDSAATLFLALAATASPTAYTVQVAAQGYYELPNDSLGYVGPISGVWSSATGAARVTELLP